MKVLTSALIALLLSMESAAVLAQAKREAILTWEDYDLTVEQACAIDDVAAWVLEGDKVVWCVDVGPPVTSNEPPGARPRVARAPQPLGRTPLMVGIRVRREHYASMLHPNAPFLSESPTGWTYFAEVQARTAAHRGSCRLTPHEQQQAPGVVAMLAQYESKDC